MTANAATRSGASATSVWPALVLDAWEDTYQTLHRWTQIVGKTRLALAPMQNHWWQTTLYVTSRGLTTSPMPLGGRTFEVDFDFREHALVVQTSDGGLARMPLQAESVSEFYSTYMSTLRSLDLDVRIWPVPRELEDALPFTEDRSHASYDPAKAEAWFLALIQVDRVLKEFRGRFVGKSSPVQLWWGAFDLACTRFSGKRAPLHPGGVPNCADYVQWAAYSHECISAGFWPGSGPVREAAFYAYAYPEPTGLGKSAVRPSAAYYHEGLHEFILPYEAVRLAPDPDGVLVEFLESTYDAAASKAGWDRPAFALSRSGTPNEHVQRR